MTTTRAAHVAYRYSWGLGGAYCWQLWGTGDHRIDGLYLGRTADAAQAGLAEFNARRAALGLPVFVVDHWAFRS